MSLHVSISSGVKCEALKVHAEVKTRVNYKDFQLTLRRRLCRSFAYLQVKFGYCGTNDCTPVTTIAHWLDLPSFDLLTQFAIVNKILSWLCVTNRWSKTRSNKRSAFRRNTHQATRYLEGCFEEVTRFIEPSYQILNQDCSRPSTKYNVPFAWSNQFLLD